MTPLDSSTHICQSSFMYLTRTTWCLLTFSTQFTKKKKEKSIHTWFLLGAHDTPLDSNTHICQSSFMSLFQKFSKVALSFRISLVAQQMPLYIHNHLHISLWFSSTPTSPSLDLWKVASPNTYHTHSKCKMRFWPNYFIYKIMGRWQSHWYTWINIKKKKKLIVLILI